jgi:hypothetical protein
VFAQLPMRRSHGAALWLAFRECHFECHRIGKIRKRE